MAGLLTQRALAQVWNEGSQREAAKIAFKVDRQVKLQHAVDIMTEYMSRRLDHCQGPCARFKALEEARLQVEAVLVFPKPSHFGAQLDLYMRSQQQQAAVTRGGRSCKRVAQQLNIAEQPCLVKLASQYFYSKIVTDWTVGANQGHIEDKLQSLLPLLADVTVAHVVQGAAASCQHQMNALIEQKSEEAGSHRPACFHV